MLAAQLSPVSGIVFVVAVLATSIVIVAAEALVPSGTGPGPLEVIRGVRSAVRRSRRYWQIWSRGSGTLPECHSGCCLPTGPGTVTGHPLSSGATTRSASPSASAEHSASHFIPSNPATSRQ
jgi:hypothetical protein